MSVYTTCLYMCQSFRANSDKMQLLNLPNYSIADFLSVSIVIGILPFLLK